MGQNHIHVSKVRHTSEFLFSIYWWILKNQKNQTFEKMKMFAGDIIILHMCTKNHNHMRYSSWDTKWDGICCHFGPYFAFLTPFPPKPNNPQNQNLKKKWKKHLQMSSFQTCATKKHDHMIYAYSDMEFLHRHNFFVISGHFLLFCATIDPKN